MIEWNKVIYDDFMNEENGLPTLEDKSIDLCLTDPPYNQNFKAGLNRYNDKYTVKKINYEDNLTDIEYKDWCYKWFNELKRICKGIIFTCGYKNRQIWFDKEIFEIIIWYNNYRQGASKIAHLNKFEIVLCYGKFNSRFNLSVFHYNSGFNMVFDPLISIHPCPKPIKFYNWIIKQTKPKSVLDPFLGSGTTALACKKLNIPWIGYEKNEIYSQDINKRLNSINLSKSGLSHWF